MLRYLDRSERSRECFPFPVVECGAVLLGAVFEYDGISLYAKLLPADAVLNLRLNFIEGKTRTLVEIIIAREWRVLTGNPCSER